MPKKFLKKALGRPKKFKDLRKELVATLRTLRPCVNRRKGTKTGGRGQSYRKISIRAVIQALNMNPKPAYATVRSALKGLRLRWTYPYKAPNEAIFQEDLDFINWKSWSQ